MKHHETIESLLNNVTLTKSCNPELERLRLKLRMEWPTLLIAEDNPVNRLLLTSILGKNATVETVEDGEQAVAICSQQHFNAILLDLQMPFLNGLEAAHIIRNQSMLNQQTPIILISANSCDLSQAELPKAGIELCLQKPIDEEVLIGHLLKMIGKSKTAIINWPSCLQKVSGNESLATEFLAQFINELQKNRIEFYQLIEAKDIAGLERAAHKLLGACCFCGVPTLQNHVAYLEKLAATAQHSNELQAAFAALIRSIDAVIAEYETSYRTHLLV